MTIRYLLDTDVLSEPLRPNPNRFVLQAMERHRGELALATVVWHELLFGCYRLPQSRKRRAIEMYLFEVVEASMPIVPYGPAAANWHAQERARLSLIGRPPSFADSQIVAIANVNDLILVTANLKDYSHFEGTQVLSWHN